MNDAKHLPRRSRSPFFLKHHPLKHSIWVVNNTGWVSHNPLPGVSVDHIPLVIVSKFFFHSSIYCKHSLTGTINNNHLKVFHDQLFQSIVLFSFWIKKENFSWCFSNKTQPKFLSWYFIINFEKLCWNYREIKDLKTTWLFFWLKIRK